MLHSKKVWHRCLRLAGCLAIARALTELSFAITLTGCFAIAFSEKFALAQIAPDTTLGTENSIVTPSINVKGRTADRIDGGAVRGAHLFHSFSQFNITNGQRVYFANPSGIENILSRVTGNNVSNILGTLGVLGNANLFLINPNGIIFGSNARLDIAGSFVASTADSLVFDNGFAFSATAAQAPPLLTINVPIGLQYAGNAGSIQVLGSRLQVPNGETLALVGGLVSLDGAGVGALGGRVELAAVGGAGIVGLSVNDNDLRLSFPDTLARADVSLTNGAFVDVTAGGGGSIAIAGQNVNVTGESALLAGIGSELGSIDSRAGDIDINASGAIAVRDGSVISNSVLAGGTGNGGNINITTGSLTVTDAAVLDVSTFGRGNAGSANVLAREGVYLDGATSTRFPSGIFSLVNEGAVGNGGSINITTELLSVTNGAALASSTSGRGNGGSVNIYAGNTVSFDGVSGNGFASGVFNQVVPGAVGNGGSINITTESLSVTNGAALSASTNGQGNGGSINIDAGRTVSFDGSGSDGSPSRAASQVQDGGVGQGGNLNITTASLSLTNGAQLSTSTYGQGDAGNVNIRADSTVSFDGIDRNGVFQSGALSAVEQGAVGKGGNIDITTASLSVANGAQLVVSTLGQGDAGILRIRATDTVSFDGVGSNGRSSGAFSSVEPGGVGKGGNIEIATSSLRVTNGATLTAATLTGGQGKAGTVTIRASDTVTFDGVGSNGQSSRAFSRVERGTTVNGGDIEIAARVLSVTNGAELNVSTQGQGEAGNIILLVGDGVTLAGMNSGILANTAPSATGSGGSIFIDSRTLTIRDDARVAVDSQGTGKGGDIQIQAGSLILENRASISAETASNTGGDIKLQASDYILMRNGSLINARAFNNGSGGNIDINAGFVVAVPREDSDIIADASKGPGGRIGITARGIFGLELRDSLTPLSDINASSESGVDGVVEINTPDIDPSRGLAELPTNLVDPSRQIAQSCPGTGGATARKQSEFIVTGTGGLPASPSEPFRGDAVWHDLRPLTQQTANRSAEVVEPKESGTKKLVEAQGWTIGANGEVILTASASTVTLHNLEVTPIACQGS